MNPYRFEKMDKISNIVFDSLGQKIQHCFDSLRRIILWCFYRVDERPHIALTGWNTRIHVFWQAKQKSYFPYFIRVNTLTPIVLKRWTKDPTLFGQFGTNYLVVFLQGGRKTTHRFSTLGIRFHNIPYTFRQDGPIYLFHWYKHEIYFSIKDTVLCLFIVSTLVRHVMIGTL